MTIYKSWSEEVVECAEMMHRAIDNPKGCGDDNSFLWAIHNILAKGKKNVLNEAKELYINRHSQCIASDGDYTDREMCEILSNVIKSDFVKDVEALDLLIKKADEI